MTFGFKYKLGRALKERNKRRKINKRITIILSPDLSQKQQGQKDQVSLKQNANLPTNTASWKHLVHNLKRLLSNNRVQTSVDEGQKITSKKIYHLSE